MKRGAFILLISALLLIFVPEPILSKRPFGGGRGHSYPKSGGLSGGGSHSYPSSGGLSGGGHGYPSSGGSHGYPSSGGSHGYPSSGGSHGYPASGGLSGNSRGYPAGNTGTSNHGYPAGNTGTSNHGYPGGKPLSGNSPSNTGHTTVIHNHYNYNPPKQISYAPAYGGPARTYPVYHGTPPTYVYQYKDSGSKYGTLLAGLALLNLGSVAASAYAVSKSHSNYKPQPGEICKFGVKKDNGDYEETKIDCQLITSFIFEEQAKNSNTGSNGTVVTTTVTNVTVVNTTNAAGGVAEQPTVKQLYEMLPNGTLVPVNNTMANTTVSAPTNNSSDTTMTSSVTVTTTNTTVTNALDVKGKPIDVTPGMQCYVLRHSSTSNMKRSIPCGLLQTYAEKSLQKKNSAFRNVPFFTSISVLIIFLCY